jgi:hypothetical protein
VADVHLVSVRVVDDSGRSGNVNVFLPAATTLAQAQTWFNSFAAALDAITGAKLDSASIALALSLPGSLKASALADHPIQWGANWGFDIANTPYRWTMHIPAVDQGIVSGDEIDRAPAYVTTFEGLLVTGDGTVTPTGRDGGDIAAVLDAVVAFRKA